MKKSLRTAAACLLPFAFVAMAEAAPGDLDPTFGSGGTALANFGGFSRGYDLARQPDGKIVAAGLAIIPSGTDYVQQFAVARFLTNGLLDSTFGTNGLVTMDLGFITAEGVAIDSAGRIVLVGASEDGGIGFYKLTVMRLLPDGSIDSGFGSGGMAFLPRPYNTFAWGYDVAADGDDRVVATGIRGMCAGVFPVGFCRIEMVAVRFTEDGLLDPTFGLGGIVSLRHPAMPIYPLEDWGTALLVLADGAVLVGGALAGDFGIVRLTSAGIPDPAWGSQGFVRTDFSGRSRVESMSLHGDKIIAAGGAAAQCLGCEAEAIAIARYLPDGSLDQGFANGGMLVASLGRGARGLAVQANGSSIVSDANTVRRYLSDGGVDSGFGQSGVVTTASSALEALALEPDGKILAVGYTTNSLSVTRLLGT